MASLFYFAFDDKILRTQMILPSSEASSRRFVTLASASASSSSSRPPGLPPHALPAAGSSTRDMPLQSGRPGPTTSSSSKPSRPSSRATGVPSKSAFSPLPVSYRNPDNFTRGASQLATHIAATKRCGRPLATPAMAIYPQIFLTKIVQYLLNKSCDQAVDEKFLKAVNPFVTTSVPTNQPGVKNGFNHQAIVTGAFKTLWNISECLRDVLLEKTEETTQKRNSSVVLSDIVQSLFVTLMIIVEGIPCCGRAFVLRLMQDTHTLPSNSENISEATTLSNTEILIRSFSILIFNLVDPSMPIDPAICSRSLARFRSLLGWISQKIADEKLSCNALQSWTHAIVVAVKNNDCDSYRLGLSVEGLTDSVLLLPSIVTSDGLKESFTVYLKCGLVPCLRLIAWNSQIREKASAKLHDLCLAFRSLSQKLVAQAPHNLQNEAPPILIMGLALLDEFLEIMREFLEPSDLAKNQVASMCDYKELYPNIKHLNVVLRLPSAGKCINDMLAWCLYRAGPWDDDLSFLELVWLPIIERLVVDINNHTVCLDWCIKIWEASCNPIPAVGEPVVPAKFGARLLKWTLSTGHAKTAMCNVRIFCLRLLGSLPTTSKNVSAVLVRAFEDASLLVRQASVQSMCSRALNSLGGGEVDTMILHDLRSPDHCRVKRVKGATGHVTDALQKCKIDNPYRVLLKCFADFCQEFISTIGTSTDQKVKTLQDSFLMWSRMLTSHVLRCRLFNAAQGKVTAKTSQLISKFLVTLQAHLDLQVNHRKAIREGVSGCVVAIVGGLIIGSQGDVEIMKLCYNFFSESIAYGYLNQSQTLPVLNHVFREIQDGQRMIDPLLRKQFNELMRKDKMVIGSESETEKDGESLFSSFFADHQAVEKKQPDLALFTPVMLAKRNRVTNTAAFTDRHRIIGGDNLYLRTSSDKENDESPERKSKFNANFAKSSHPTGSHTSPGKTGASVPRRSSFHTRNQATSQPSSSSAAASRLDTPLSTRRVSLPAKKIPRQQ